MPQNTNDVFATSYDAFLFDLDGTLINSILAAERVWSRWAEKHGLDVEAFLPTMHGKRGIDTIRGLALPGVDPLAEAADVERGEIEDVEGVVTIEGAAAFLSSLPPSRWTIVTSSPINLAKARLGAVGLTLPSGSVTAEDVTVGKPDPSGYRLGASRLGFDPSRCLVFEDVPAGVQAGKAAGADVMVITSTHQHEHALGEPSIIDYREISATTDEDGRLRLVRR